MTIDSTKIVNQDSEKTIFKLLVTSILLALIYGYSHYYFINSPFILIKVSSILFLAIITKFYPTHDLKFSALLFTGLLFHCIGDFTIEIAGTLLLSIPFFFIGHTIYCVILFRDIKTNYYINKRKFSLWKYLLIIAILISAVFISKFILNGIAAKFSDNFLLFYGILFYISILVVLLALSILHPACLKFLFIGVLFYALSDCIIAYHEFIQQQIVLRKLLSWPLYYGAQVLISFSLLHYHYKKDKQV